jgi:hypothetical protein
MRIKAGGIKIHNGRIPARGFKKKNGRILNPDPGAANRAQDRSLCTRSHPGRVGVFPIVSSLAPGFFKISELAMAELLGFLECRRQHKVPLRKIHANI